MITQRRRMIHRPGVPAGLLFGAGGGATRLACSRRFRYGNDPGPVTEDDRIARHSQPLAPTRPTLRPLARSWSPAALAVLLMLPGGCATYRPTQSGFLSSYAALTPDRFHVNRGIGLQRASTFEAAPAELARIDSYYIEPVEWRVDPTSRGGKSPERRDWLCSVLDQTLREQLAATKPVVDRPGPRTARVRSAITVVRLSRPVSNAFLTATMISPYGIGPVFFGGGAVEAEVISPDGRQIAAVSSASGGGWFDIVGYYTRSNHAKKAMKRCAEELVQAVNASTDSPHASPQSVRPD